jgi:hypothetical protein
MSSPFTGILLRGNTYRRHHGINEEARERA